MFLALLDKSFFLLVVFFDRDVVLEDFLELGANSLEV
jgi:hypothetical protein